MASKATKGFCGLFSHGNMEYLDNSLKSQYIGHMYFPSRKFVRNLAIN